MSRTLAVSLFALAAFLPLAAGCGRSDRPQTSSAGASTPTVAASSTGSTDTGTATEAVPASYADAESSFKAGRYPEAVQLFTSYTVAHPENPWGFYMLGLSAWRSGQHREAMTAFDQALQLDPNHQKSLYNSGRVLLETGKATAALARIEKALALEPSSNEGLRLLGRARYQTGQVDEAIEAYHRALAADDRDVWSMNNLGLIYLDQGRSREALAPLARAVELRGNAPVFQKNLGTALERSGYRTAAAKTYEAAISADSTYREAAVALARVTVEPQPDSEAVDLPALSRTFQGDIETWRESTLETDSSAAISEPVRDSTAPGITGLSDSSVAAVEAVTDTLEDCEQE